MHRLMVIAAMIIGAVIMAWLDRSFFWPETETVIEEVYTTDTVTNTIVYRDTITLTNTILDKQIDTVYYSEPFKADISVYNGSYKLDYGKIDWKAETTGKLVNLEFKPFISIPEKTITNTVTRTTTNTIYNKGLYLGGNIDSNLVPSISGSYINKKWSIDATYTPKIELYSVGFKTKIF